MKKLWAVSSVVVILGCGVAVAGCTGGNSGSGASEYQGALSEEIYESVDSAVQGYLETEVSGMAITAVYVGYEKKAELSKEEIANLPIDEENAKGIVSAERGTVEYTEAEGKSVAYFVAAQSDETYTKEVYILLYENGAYRFYSPALKENDDLTASYFASLFNNEDFMNCTMETTAKSDMGGAVTEITMVAKMTGEAMYSSQNYSVTFESTKETINKTTIGYLMNSTSGMVAISSVDGGKWQAEEVNLNEGKTIEDMMKRQYKENLGQFDHTYFEKTATGYKIKDSRMKAMIESYGVTFDNDCVCEYEITVSEGKIKAWSMNMSYTVHGVKCSQTGTARYYDYGTTMVEVPAEVKALLSA